MSLSGFLLVLLLPLTRPAAPPALPPSPDSLTAAVDSARRAAEAGDARAAAEAYGDAARHAPGVERWLALSALHQLARAGAFEEAAALARGLGGDPVLPEDSVRLELVRAAFAAGEPGRALREAEGLDGRGAPELWTERVAPALLAEGDTAGAVAALRSAVSADSAPMAAGALLVELDPGWRARAEVAESDRRSGRDARAREMLAGALEAAPPPRAPELAARMAESALEAGDGARLHALLEGWLPREDLPARVRARLELAHGRHHLRRGPRGRAAAPLERAAAAAGREAAYASYLLADRALARGDQEEARRRFASTASRFPRTRYGRRSLVLLGTLAYREGEHGEAAEWFESAARSSPGRETGRAGLYWAGRARQALGRGADARASYLRLARASPVSYYGLEAAGRAGEDVLAALLEEGGSAGAGGGATGGPPDASGAAPGGPSPGAQGAGEARNDGSGAALDRLLERMDLLRGLGWPWRAVRELDVHRRRLEEDPRGLLDLARRLNASGWTVEGTAVAWRVFDLDGGRLSRGLLRELFPVAHREALVAAARAEGLEPAFVAALVRQESVFDRSARSRAGAVGLMQLLPETARSLARREGMEDLDPEDLEDPSTNLLLGTRYLAWLLSRFDGSRVAALVSYNAGPDRFLRWRRMPEFRAGEELFIERIPFAETRRYVKSVVRNLHLYRRLHDLGPGSGNGEEADVDDRESGG